MILHPHIHCLVTEGGLRHDRWMQPRQKGYLLPVRAVMALFRGKLLAYIDAAIQKNLIVLPNTMTPQQWKNLRNKLGRTKWNVHIRERYDHGQGILVYLARYIRAGAMANKRIISCDTEQVVFTYKTADRSTQELITLSSDTFIQRYLLHVPYPHTKVVRYYGLYAPAAQEALTRCRSFFGQDALEDPEPGDWQTFCEKHGSDHPERCPVCGSRLIRVMDIPRFPYQEALYHAA